jgi:vesicle coat complex subunit
VAKKRIDDLLSELSSENEDIRKSAAIKLGDFKDSLAVSALKSALTDTSAAVRFYAKKSLKKLEKEFGSDEIGKAIPIDEEVSKKIGSIYEMVEQKKIKELLACLKDEEGLVRAAAIGQLPNLVDLNNPETKKKIVGILFHMLQDPHSRVVANSVEAVERLGIKCHKILGSTFTTVALVI